MHNVVTNEEVTRASEMEQANFIKGKLIKINDILTGAGVCLVCNAQQDNSLLLTNSEWNRSRPESLLMARQNYLARADGGMRYQDCAIVVDAGNFHEKVLAEAANVALDLLQIVSKCNLDLRSLFSHWPAVRPTA